MDIFFTPKITDTTIVNTSHKFPLALLEASTNEWRKNILSKIRPLCQRIAINPTTNRFQYEVTKSIKKLPYYQDQVQLNRVFNDSTFRLDKLVKPTIQYQLDCGADILIAPYFFSDDINSQRFNTNIEIVSDSVKNLQARNENKPLYVVINISKDLIKDDIRLRSIKSIYCDDFKDDVSGYLISIDDMNDKTEDAEVLLGLLKLIVLLSEDKKEVIVTNIGDFGLVTLAFGAKSFSSGLTESEVQAVKNWDSAQKIRRKRQNFTYTHTILNYLNDEDIKKTNYSCNCAVCNGSYPTSSQEKKIHFLENKILNVNELEKRNQNERINYLKELITSAKQSALSLVSSKRVNIRSTSYYDRWLEVLDQSENLKSLCSGDEKLEEILNELDHE